MSPTRMNRLRLTERCHLQLLNELRRENKAQKAHASTLALEVNALRSAAAMHNGAAASATGSRSASASPTRRQSHAAERARSGAQSSAELSVQRQHPAAPAPAHFADGETLADHAWGPASAGSSAASQRSASPSPELRHANATITGLPGELHGAASAAGRPCTVPSGVSRPPTQQRASAACTTGASTNGSVGEGSRDPAHSLMDDLDHVVATGAAPESLLADTPATVAQTAPDGHKAVGNTFGSPAASGVLHMLDRAPQPPAASAHTVGFLHTEAASPEPAPPVVSLATRRERQRASEMRFQRAESAHPIAPLPVATRGHSAVAQTVAGGFRVLSQRRLKEGAAAAAAPGVQHSADAALSSLDAMRLMEAARPATSHGPGSLHQHGHRSVSSARSPTQHISTAPHRRAAQRFDAAGRSRSRQAPEHAGTDSGQQYVQSARRAAPSRQARPPPAGGLHMKGLLPQHEASQL